MKNKLLIVTDPGVFQAYKVEATPRRTSQLKPLENIVLKDAPASRDRNSH